MTPVLAGLLTVPFVLSIGMWGTRYMKVVEDHVAEPFIRVDIKEETEKLCVWGHRWFDNFKLLKSITFYLVMILSAVPGVNLLMFFFGLFNREFKKAIDEFIFDIIKMHTILLPLEIKDKSVMKMFMVESFLKHFEKDAEEIKEEDLVESIEALMDAIQESPENKQLEEMKNDEEIE